MSAATIAVLLGVGAAVVAVSASIGGAKAGRAAERSLHRTGRTGSIAGRALGIGAAILAVQWLVVRATTDPVTIAAVLALPALVTGICAARLLAGPDVVRVSSRSLR
jgi:hypothetical protein